VTVEQLQWLVAYNFWANTRLLSAAAAVGAEERERDLQASFGSLHGTLAHILWGERGWLQFWQAGKFVPNPSASDYAHLASLESAWSQHEEAYEAYLLGLTQAQLEAPRTLDGTTYSLGELVQHALNHSTYHRGQVALLLRQLGHLPPATDFHDFLGEKRAKRGGCHPGC
jgi:uncharacterized damage-inducible protein DinB